MSGQIEQSLQLVGLFQLGFFMWLTAIVSDLTMLQEVQKRLSNNTWCYSQRAGYLAVYLPLPDCSNLLSQLTLVGQFQLHLLFRRSVTVPHHRHDTPQFQPIRRHILTYTDAKHALSV